MIIFEGKQLIEMQGFGGEYHEKASAQAGFDFGNKGDQNIPSLILSFMIFLPIMISVLFSQDLILRCSVSSIV